MGIQAFAHRQRGKELVEPSLDELPTMLADPSWNIWVDIEGVLTEDMEKLLKDTFNFHPLLIEDIFQESIPKVEQHEAFLYLIVHGIDPETRDPRSLNTIELDIVLGRRFILTHHDRPMYSVRDVKELVRKRPERLGKGAAYVAHSLLDHVVDRYVPIMDKFDDSIDELEVKILRSPVPTVLEEIFELKRSLQRLRRVSMHQKEILFRLSRGEFDLIPKDARPFYRDVYDHFVGVSELADSYRELVSASLDAYLSMQSNRLNETMRTLTRISTVMLPLTFIAGIYGMNFEYMPELHWKAGYPIALATMAITGIGFLWYFKKRGF